MRNNGDAETKQKWKRVKSLHQNIHKLDRILDTDGIAGDMNAIVVRLMRHTGMRVGSEKSIRGRLVKNATFGATTLRAKHARLNHSGLILDFVGKKGVVHHHVVKDRLLINTFRKLLHTRSRNDPLFDGVTDKSTITYLRHALRIPDIKNHDLRTYVANYIAISEIQKLNPPRNEKEYRNLRNFVGQVVASKLGNGKYHALNSYINPILFEKWRNFLT